MKIFKNLAVAGIKILRKFLDLSPNWISLNYDIRNEKEFGNLYEHEKMLADSVRIENYKKGIQKYINSGDIVLDVGTGTGILSFFAASKKPKKIYAIDHSNFIEIAREIAKHNNIEDIEFIKTNSRNYNPDVKFDVIIHEQIGDYLFNENMIVNLLDLKKRLLKPTGKILPGKFELFLEPTSLDDSFNVPFIWENQIEGIDFGFLKDYTLEGYKGADYEHEWIESKAVKYFLCPADPVLIFDLNSLNSENEIPRSINISKKIVTPGAFDGFCLFFKVIFDEDVFFETSPLSTNTHWGNCFFRAERRELSGGETINFKLNMPDLLDIKTWSVYIKSIQKLDGEKP